MTVLPHVLAPDLDVVFCGSAPGTVSARVGAYYAGPGNRFWPILHRAGFTPYQLKPSEFRSVLQYGIGLTDLAIHTFGADSTLKREDFRGDELRQNVERYAPRVLAFVGKRPAQEFYGHPVSYGQQPDLLGQTTVFVLPSTSGLATKFWDESWWFQLAAWVKETSPR
jgi:double-stranded uracil-DNA glycosylase